MRIFLDTANIDEIREASKLGVMRGVTTNPSLLAKERTADMKAVVQEIASIVDGPISAEVLSLEPEAMIREARQVSSWASNVVVKIPMSEAGLEAISVLSSEDIKTNLTLCFSLNQALLGATAGATYVSPFVGRLDDIGHTGMDLVRDIRMIFDNYGFKCEILAASIRNPIHVVEAAQAGADVGTMPFAVLESLLKHPLTDSGLKKFLQDWEKVPRPTRKG